MKKIAIGFLLAGLTVGCGKKYERPLTEYEQKSAKLEEAIGKWYFLKKRNKVTKYSYKYSLKDYWLAVDVLNDKLYCRQRTTLWGENSNKVDREFGDDINTNDWDGLPKAYTFEQIHEECRRVIKETPEARLSHTWGGALLWCDGAFGDMEGPGLLGYSTSELACDRPKD